MPTAEELIRQLIGKLTLRTIASQFHEDSPALSPLHKDDLFSRGFFHLVQTAGEISPRLNASVVLVPTTSGPLKKIDVVPGFISIPTDDENVGDLSEKLKPILECLCALPIIDDDRAWASETEALDMISRFLTPMMPPALNNWVDVTSDKTMGLMAFQGMAAHRLEPLENDPFGAAYVVDLTWMAGYSVRAELEPYGAAAYFGSDRTLLRVYTPHDDTTHVPGDAGWEQAKWRWRCSLFTAVTLVDHLGGIHLLCSNIMTVATREQLPADHALRRLLSPHIFGSTNVNVIADFVLSNPRGMAFRLFGFNYPDLVRLLVRGGANVAFEPFPKTMAAKHLDVLGDLYPYATDGLAFYNIINDYVRDYLEIFSPARAQCKIAQFDSGGIPSLRWPRMPISPRSKRSVS